MSVVTTLPLLEASAAEEVKGASRQQLPMRELWPVAEGLLGSPVVVNVKWSRQLRAQSTRGCYICTWGKRYTSMGKSLILKGIDSMIANEYTVQRIFCMVIFKDVWTLFQLSLHIHISLILTKRPCLHKYYAVKLN